MSNDDAKRDDQKAEAGNVEGEPADGLGGAPGTDAIGTDETGADETGADGSGAGAPASDAPERSDAGPVAEPASGSRGGALFFLALSFSVIAIAATGFLWWQYRQFCLELSDIDVEQRRELEDARANQRRLADEITALASEQAEDRREAAGVARALEDVQPRLAALDQRIDALQGGNFDARDVWFRAEAEYYLATANTELAVAGHFENAIIALELADGLLRQLGNPALNPVRGAIADEISSLRAVRLPDTEGLAFSIASLAGRIPELPMRGTEMDTFSSDAPGFEEIEPGLGRLWHGVKEAVLGIVRIERREVPVDVVLTAAERSVAQRQVELELALARVALLRGQQEAFVASLGAAADLLRRDFDRAAPAVTGALQLLEEMQRLDIAPRRPDISRSLNLLRASPGGTG